MGEKSLTGTDAALETSAVGSALASALRRCSEACEQTLERYRSDSRVSRRFVSSVFLADAALKTAAQSIEADGHRREVSLAIASSLCREAAEAIRAHGLDEGLLRCAGACERVAHLCEQALAPWIRQAA